MWVAAPRYPRQNEFSRGEGDCPRMHRMHSRAAGGLQLPLRDGVDPVARMDANATHYYGLFATAGKVTRVGVCFPPADGLLTTRWHASYSRTEW